jgi:hypothetical protein
MNSGIIDRRAAMNPKFTLSPRLQSLADNAAKCVQRGIISHGNAPTIGEKESHHDFLKRVYGKSSVKRF